MRQATLFRYTVPVAPGLVLRHQRMKSREGLIVRLEQDGLAGEGEIAPLPGFSPETLAQATEAACGLLRRWSTYQIGGAPASSQTNLPASAAFGFSCAQAELDGQLPAASFYRTVPLCVGDPDTLIAKLSALPGEKIAKVKVGLYEAAGDALIINLLLSAVPDLRLRLDANRAWSPARAAAFARGLEPAFAPRIDFIEEPCASPADSLSFARDTGLPIAWDESLREAGFTLGPQPGVAAAIIKPTLTGSLARCRALIDTAHGAGLTAVISASIESSLGLTQLARLAQWLTPGVQPGLDTLSLMQWQLIRAWPGSTLPLRERATLQILAQYP